MKMNPMDVKMFEIEVNGEIIYFNDSVTIGPCEDEIERQEQKYTIIIPDKLAFKNYANKILPLRDLVRTFNFDNLIADRN